MVRSDPSWGRQVVAEGADARVVGDTDRRPPWSLLAPFVLVLGHEVGTLALLGPPGPADGLLLEPMPSVVVHWILILGATVPLLLRRARPLLTLGLVSAASAGQVVLLLLPFGPAWFVALYSVGAHSQRSQGLVALAAVLGFTLPAEGSVAALEAIEGDTWTTQLGNLLSLLVAVLGAWALGAYVRTRRQVVSAREQALAQQQRLAVVAERRRIARELHDVVTHTLGVIVMHAGAARLYLREDPKTAAEALGLVERLGRDSVAELRRGLVVLRDDGGEQVDALLEPAGAGSPQPGLEQLPALVERYQQVGLPVTLGTFEVSAAEAGADGEELPSGVGLSAYRIVQEALTNALRHATATVVEVAVRTEECDGGRATLVRVRNDGAPPEQASRRAGLGTTGMRERAALLGGHLSAGPDGGGGYEVEALLPWRASPAVMPG